MKKNLLFSVLALAISVRLFAQTIPDNDFEAWAAGNPQGWQSTNLVTTNVTQSSDSHMGSSAASLKTVSNFVSIPAAMVSGTAKQSGSSIAFTGGFPYAVRAQTFSGYYKYAPGPGGDSSLMQVWLFKRNTSTGKRDTVASTTFRGSKDTVSSYTLFSSNFIYHSGAMGDETPDSALIFICSSYILNISGPKPGSTLLIDDITFSGNVATAVKELKKDNSDVSIYPNPAANEVSLKTNLADVAKINVFDVLGKKVRSVYVSSQVTTFSVNGLNNGMYFYQLMNSHEEILTTGRFSVKN